MSQDPVLKREEAAEYMGLKPQTLAAWKCRQQDGPEYIKIGRTVRYRQSALDAWLEKNTVRAEK